MALTTASFSTTEGPGGLSSSANPMNAAVCKALGVPRTATNVATGKPGGRRGGR